LLLIPPATGSSAPVVALQRARGPRYRRIRSGRAGGATSSRRRTISRFRPRFDAGRLGRDHSVKGGLMITIRGGERYTHRVSSLIAGGVLTVLLAIALEPARGYAQGAPGPISADPNLKVAFIGDSGNGADFRRVLQLIKAEGAHMVLHQGDFDYADNARRFFATIDSILGDDFPYFAAVGNHDAGSWRQDCSRRDGCYAKFLKTRMARIGVTPDDPDLDD